MCIFMLQGMIHFSFFIFKFKCSQFQQLLFHLIEHFQVNSSYATHTSFLLQNQLKHPLTCCIYQHTPFLSPSCLPGLSDFWDQTIRELYNLKLNGWFKIWINVCTKTSSILLQTSNLGLILKILFLGFVRVLKKNFWMIFRFIERKYNILVVLFYKCALNIIFNIKCLYVLKTLLFIWLVWMNAIFFNKASNYNR